MFGDKYATLAELQDRLGDTGPDDVSRLNAALDAATSGINRICGRQFNNDGMGVTSQRKYRPDSSAYFCDVDDFYTTDGLLVNVTGADWQEGVQFEVDPINGVVDGVPGYAYEKLVAIQGNSFLPLWPREYNVLVTAPWGWQAVPTGVHEGTLIGAEELFKMRDTPFGIGGYGDFGIIKVRDNPFVCRQVEQYIRNPILVA